MQDMPMKQPPQGADEEGQEGGSPDQLLMAAHESLMKLGEIVLKSNQASPELKQKLGMIIKAIEAFGQEMAGGGKQAQAPGNTPVEAGANPNARPMM